MIKKSMKLLFKNPMQFAYKVSKKIKHPLIKKLTNINTLSQDTVRKTDIIIYFYGEMGQTYQIKQWIDTFYELNKQYKITIVIRKFDVYQYWSTHLKFNLWYCDTIVDLMDFYDKADPPLILYINNGVKNYQSFLYEKSLHVFLNHGESDKSSDHSNQIKCYDYTFVHGPNGHNNYLKYLINLDAEKLIQTGRPQLDFIRPIKLDTKGRSVIAYVTTYEATHRSMRYTSVDIYGEKIVDQILESDQYFFIYKPHPNLGGNDQEVKAIHNRILQKVKNNPYAITLDKEEVNNIYPIVDFAIFDISSTMTDFLNVDKPFLLADVFNPKVHNLDAYNILKGCNRITHNNIDHLMDVIKTEITTDPLQDKRSEVKKLYLGDYKPQESIGTFLKEIDIIVKQRNTLSKDKETTFENRFTNLFTERLKSQHFNQDYTQESGTEEVAVYFSNGVDAVWELQKFEKVFLAINKLYPLNIIVRNKKVFQYLKSSTPFNITYCYTINELLTYYEDSNIKTILYINDEFKNFQSLIYHRALHAYLDFGKNNNYISASSQSKGYDYVYIQNDEVYKEYEKNLININPKNYLVIGNILDENNTKSLTNLLESIKKSIQLRDKLLKENGMTNTIH